MENNLPVEVGKDVVSVQLFRERLSEKSAKVYVTILKGTVGIFREF